MKYLKKPIKNAELTLVAFCNCGCNGCKQDTSSCNNKCPSQCGAKDIG